jgi:hypothetical protein
MLTWYVRFGQIDVFGVFDTSVRNRLPTTGAPAFVFSRRLRFNPHLVEAQPCSDVALT